MTRYCDVYTGGWKHEARRAADLGQEISRLQRELAAARDEIKSLKKQLKQK